MKTGVILSRTRIIIPTEEDLNAENKSRLYWIW